MRTGRARGRVLLGDLDGGLVEEDHAVGAEGVPVEVPGLLVEADQQVHVLAVAVDPLLAHAHLVHARAALDLGRVGAERLGPVPAARRGLGEDVPRGDDPLTGLPGKPDHHALSCQVRLLLASRAATGPRPARGPSVDARSRPHDAAAAGRVPGPRTSRGCYRQADPRGKIPHMSTPSPPPPPPSPAGDGARSRAPGRAALVPAPRRRARAAGRCSPRPGRSGSSAGGWSAAARTSPRPRSGWAAGEAASAAHPGGQRSSGGRSAFGRAMRPAAGSAAS